MEGLRERLETVLGRPVAGSEPLAAVLVELLELLERTRETSAPPDE